MQHLKSILSHWGFTDNVQIQQEDIIYETAREPHVWTINESYILKMTTTKTEMTNNINFSNQLKSVNIPAQQVVLTTDEKSYVQEADKYYGLFTKLQGDVLKDYFDKDFESRGYYLGTCLASLHQGLNQITPEFKVWDNNMLEEFSGWVEDEIMCYLPKCQLPCVEIEHFKGIKSEVLQHLNALYPSLPRQIIHRDFHSENMIFDEEVLVGYIDFDLSQINARLFDVCYLGTSSLVSIFNDEERRAQWLPFFKSVVAGYDDKNALISEEKQSIKDMLCAIELVMVAYFARSGYPELANTNIEMVNYINDVWEQ